MALEPITRQEKIIAGQDLKPITRMEKFLKDFGGSGGGGSRFDINLTFNEDNTVAIDKTFAEIKEAHNSGKVVCLVNSANYSIAHICMTPVDEYGLSFVTVSAMMDGSVFIDTYYVNVDNTVDFTEVKVTGTAVFE